MKGWERTDPEEVGNGKYLGELGVGNREEPTEIFSVIRTTTRLVFGGACNVGFMESGYMDLETDETTDEALCELSEDLDTYYADGGQYCSRIVCNERM